MRGARTEAGRQLERLFRGGTVGGLTDSQLLEQFVAGDDEAAEIAFEAIVERHGPMVLRVCRTVLRDIHAAEDAFQAITSWTTQPRYGSEPVATYEFEPGEGWKLFDITPIVRARAKAGHPKHGLVLRFRSENFSAGPNETFSDYQLVSREGVGEWASRRPVLLVVKAAKAEPTPAR